MLDLGPATRRVARLLDGVGDDRLGGPTPCPGYTVRELLGHLAGLAVAFRAAARKDFGPATDTDPEAAGPVPLPEDWRVALPRLLEGLAGAWAAPEAWEGTTRAGGVTLQGEVAGLVALNEVLIHGWDLARATGQEYAPDEASLEASYAMLAPTADDPEQRGPFGPPVPVPEGAPLLDRVIGLSGRRPDWAPAAGGGKSG
ncbi:TIGR03086 family metal-binding protein [Streptomyces sp. NPDC015131]|uniref:TIGR03086 family metal-binding protein n=1 Tax=Streptomyces sp. NPDC015131 TaxID=3364941 RepID=UPI0036FA9378